MKFKKLLAVCTTALLAFGLAGLGAVSASAGGGNDGHKVTICHANEGSKDWSPNGNSVDKDSIMNPPGAGHDSHANDIIPAFSAGSHHHTTWDAYPGKNLNTLFDGVLGSVILANGCSIPAPPTPQDALASATATPASCSAPGGETFSVTNAVWENTTDTTDGSREAIATAGHLFANGTDTLMVTYTIAPQLTGEQCAPLPCLGDGAVSYTYSAITNSGVVTVVAQDGHSTTLCNPFWVTASTWTFDGNLTWPQTLDNWNPANNGQQISSVGTYAYGAEVTCGQGDIYGSFNSPGVPYPTGGVLSAPGLPYTEHFLSGMGFSGPSPTFTVQDAGSCNPNIVETIPAVTFTDSCGVANDGIVGGIDTTEIDYTITDGRDSTGVGLVTVTAAPTPGHVFAADAYTGPWSHTFTDAPCVVTIEVPPAATDQTCTVDTPPPAGVGFSTMSTPGYTYQDGGITVALDANLEYTITGTGTTSYPATVVTSAFTALDPGTYTVTVGPLNGYVLSGTATTSWPVTIAEGMCAVTFGDPVVTDQTCDLFNEGETITGHIWVDFGGNLANEVNYQIVGGTYNYTATQEINNLPPGTYTVTVTAKDGFVLDPNMESVWTFTIGSAGTCSLVTHPLISTMATATNLTCATSGSYTLADTTGVLWFKDVNGVQTAVEPGTYKVSSASTVKIHAALVDSTFGWNDDAQTDWTFNFTSSADCLPTLAFTGSTNNMAGLLVAGGFLLIGGTAFAFERRFRHNTK